MRFAATASIALASLFAACQTTTDPRSEDDFMLEADEARIWERSHEATDTIRRSGMVLQNDVATDYLERICRTLYPAVDRHPSEFEVLILKDPTVNAFVLPNGVTCINTGLLSAMESEAQLAMVLAHELAHFHLRHGVDGMRHLKSQAAFHTVLGVSTLGYSNLVSMIGFPAAISGHSREAERQADELGWEWYRKAGYDKNEAHLTFEQLKRYTEKNAQKRPAFFASHPKLDQRIETIQQLAANDSGDGGIIGVENLLNPFKQIWIENALLDIDLGNLERVELLLNRFGNYDQAHRNPAYFYAKAELARKQGGESNDQYILELCERGLASNPKHPGLLRASGQANYRLEKWQQASEQLRKAVQLDPDFPKNPFITNYIAKCEANLSL